MQESPFAMTGRSAEEYLNERQKFVWRRPDRFNFVRDILYELAVTRPKGTALYWTSAENEVDIASFEALRHRVNRAAGLLRAIGVNRGDVVLVFLSREKAWWEVMLACLQLGAIASPGTTQLMEKDIAFRLRTTNAAAVVTNAALAERVDAAAEDEHWRGAKVIVEGDRAGWTAYAAFAGAPVEDCADTKADDEALWYFTSGTTGNPKMTVHGCGYPLGHETTGRFWLRAGPDDLVWNVSDTGWAKGAWSSLFAPWLCGAGIFALHANSVDPERILSWLEKFPVSILCAPPTAYRMFVRHDLNGCRPMRLRHCVSAGEPLNPEVIEIWRNKMGMQICEGYGQTETTILCGNFEGMPVKPGSMGLPAPGVNLQIIDRDGEIAPPGQEGDVVVAIEPDRPMGLFLGYKNDPQKTAQSFVNGWYLTGDRAYKDEDGYFWFVGRGDDVIISAGYRIGPFEVESALIEHPAVVESAVVSSPDEIRGEVVKAFVVLAKSHAPSDELVRELQEHVKRTTAPYKYPRKIEFVSSLPKTISGKIIRKELREREWKSQN